MAWLNHCWRWIGTALSFFLFGLGSLVIGVVILPLVALLVRGGEKRLRVTRRIVGGAMQAFVGLMAGIGVLRYEIQGLEHVDSAKGYLILANHPSLIDVVFLIALFPMADCIVKQDIFRNPITRRLVRMADYVSNTDSVELLQESVRRLKAGRSLILFPEGTRTAPDEPLQFRLGAAAIAVRAGQPCLPVVIRCDPTTLTKADRWYQVPQQQVFFRMAIQPAISPVAHLEGAPSERRPDIRFNAFLQEYFEERLAAGQQQGTVAR